MGTARGSAFRMYHGARFALAHTRTVLAEVSGRALKMQSVIWLRVLPKVVDICARQPIKLHPSHPCSLKHYVDGLVRATVFSSHSQSQDCVRTPEFICIV